MQTGISTPYDAMIGTLYRRSHCLKSSAIKLEMLIERWILDPSSFIGPDGDMGTLYRQPELN